MTSPEYVYPLRALVQASGFTSDAAMKAIGASGRRWGAANRAGLNWLTADRWAVRLGLHPYEVWPEMAIDALHTQVAVCEDCQAEYEPFTPGQRFCTERCRGRFRRASLRKDVA